MKQNLKKVYMFFLLLLVIFIINIPSVNAKSCDGDQCISCTYEGAENYYIFVDKGQYKSNYEIVKKGDTISGTFSVAEGSYNFNVINHIDDYSFFYDKDSDKLICPSIYVNISKTLAGFTEFCKSTPVGKFYFCKDDNAYTANIFSTNDSSILKTFAQMFTNIPFNLFDNTVKIEPSVSFNINELEYTCNYRGQKEQKSLQISKYSNAWEVVYPDGNSSKFNFSEVGSNIFPSSNCEDIFFVPSKNSIKATKGETQYTNATVSQYCNTYGDDIEQYCNNSICKIRNAMCGNTISNSSDDDSDCPAKLRPIIWFVKRVAFNTLKIFVPILLIVMGTIDFVKAVASSDDKGNSEAIARFIRRCIAAVMCFFVVTIVTLVMNLFAKTDNGEQKDWQACWLDID